MPEEGISALFVTDSEAYEMIMVIKSIEVETKSGNRLSVFGETNKRAGRKKLDGLAIVGLYGNWEYKSLIRRIGFITVPQLDLQ